MQLNPPVSRAETDWLTVQQEALAAIARLGKKYQCPIFWPGDLFDKWNSPPELINWAMRNIPRRSYAVAGNHDLPLHRYDDIHKSAYWTLVQTGVLTHLTAHPTMIQLDAGRPNLVVYGFSHGQKADNTRPVSRGPDKINLAVVHDYCWADGHAHPGAPEDKHWVAQMDKFKNNGFHAVVFGDNHSTFFRQAVANPGTVIARTTAEREQAPCVGLLKRDGRIVIQPLRLSAAWNVQEKPEEAEVDTTAFMRELSELGDAAVNFAVAIRRVLDKKKVSQTVRELVLSYLEDNK